MYGFIEKTSDLKEENAIYNEVVEAGKGWMHELLPGQSLRIVDMEGNQAVDTTFYDMTNPEDHYGAIPTIVMQKNIYLTTGTILRTESGKPLLEITADLTGRHDTIGGACSAQSNTVRYAREKGVLTILKAYAKIHCSEKLVLVGKGSEEDKIKDYVKEHNLEERVQINGAIFGEEMEHIIERAKVVLVPSEWYENGAFVALQALAKGKIVVASDIAGLSEIVQDGETGYLAEPGNPDSFAVAIQKALSLTETAYRDMSEHIVAYAKKRCDAGNYIKELCKIYEKLINEKQHKENR